MAENALPVVVIIHDAWHTPTHYSQLIDKLCAHGFPTACPQLLTSHVEENCTSSFNDDCSMVYQLIFDLASDGHDIIVLAHGYGGFVSTEVLGQLGKSIRKKAGLSGGVVGLVSLSGFLPAHGETLKTQFGGQWPDYLQQQKDGTLRLLQPDDFIFNDLGAMEKDHWSTHLVRFTSKADDIILSTPDPAWKTIHTTYIITEDDKLFPEELQRNMINNARNGGALVDEEFLESTGHSPIVSSSDRLIVVIIAAAAKSHGAEPAYTPTDGTNDGGDTKRFTRTATIYSDAKSGDSDYGSDTYEDAQDTLCACGTSCACGRLCKCERPCACGESGAESCSCGEPCGCASECRNGTECACGRASCACSQYCHCVAKDSPEAVEDELEVDGMDAYDSWASGLASIGSRTTTFEVESERGSGFDDDNDAGSMPPEPSSRAVDDADDADEVASTRSEPSASIGDDDDGVFDGKPLRRSTTLPAAL